MTAPQWDDLTTPEKARLWRDRDADRPLDNTGWWGDLPFMGQTDTEDKR